MMGSFRDLAKSTYRYSESAAIHYILLVLFCIVGLILVALPMLIQGRGLLWEPDGLQQYLNAQIYLGTAIRDMISTFISTGELQFDSYIFSLGYGSSINVMCCIWDPLNWISALVPVSMQEYLYYGLIVVRLALAAATFSMLYVYRGYGRPAAFVGSLCYVFAGFGLFWAALRAPFFLNVLYISPLVILGVEKIFKGEKPVFFILALAYSLILSSYFTYMLCIFVVVYYLIKYPFSNRRKSIKDFAKLSIWFVLCGIVSVLIAGFAILPSYMSITAVNRLGLESYSPLLAGAMYYIQYLPNTLGVVSGRGDAIKYIGPAVIVLVSFFILSRKKIEDGVWTPWIIGVVVVLICSSSPYLEHVIHGFSYPTDRWFFVYDFVFASIACIAFSNRKVISRGTKKSVFLLLGITAVAAIILSNYGKYSESLCVCWLIVVGLGVLSCVAICIENNAFASISIGICVLLTGCVVGIQVCASEPYGDKYGEEFLPVSTAEKFYESSPYSIIEDIDNDETELFRYSYPYIGHNRRNESLNQDRNGMSCYPVRSGYLNVLREDLGLADNASSNHYEGNDSRLALEALSGCKYYFARKNQAPYVPATYEDTGFERGGYNLYRTDYSLPVAFICTDCISENEYKALNMIEKQEAMLQGAVIDASSYEDTLSSMIEPSTTSETISFTVKDSEGIKLSAGVINVTKRDASITLEFNGLPNSETYVVAEGFESRGLAEMGITTYTIGFESSNIKRNIKNYSQKHVQYSGKKNWAVNLGYTEDGIGDVTITFNQPGIYTLNDFKIICQPISPIISSISKMQNNGTVKVFRGEDMIHIDLEASQKDSLLLITQCYSNGWCAELDGQAVDLLRADTAFMCIPLKTAGEHSITMKYETPGRIQGLYVSILGVTALIALVVAQRLREKRQKLNGAIVI